MKKRDLAKLVKYLNAEGFLHTKFKSLPEPIHYMFINGVWSKHLTLESAATRWIKEQFRSSSISESSDE